MRSKSGVFGVARQLSRTIRTMKGRLSSNWKLLLHSALGGALYWGLGLRASLAALGVFGTYLLTGGWEFTWVVIKTLPRDFRGLIVLIRVQLGVRKHLKNNDTIPMLFDRTVKRYPDKAAFIFEEEQWTYRQVDEFSNAVANYFYEAGYRKGDVVSIYMENRPEFACFWVGLSKIGVVSSLMNFNLRGEPLYHCLDISKSKAVIFGGELAEAVKEIRPRFNNDVQFFCTGPVASNDIRCVHIDSLLKKCPTYKPPSVPGSFKDKLIYIYTSGTTGLPKAAVITHIRFFYMSMGIRYGYKITSEDIIYNVLPLYHTAGGVLGMGNMMLGGTTLVVRKKFSASRYWDDCVKYNCTIGQYIGEICRYLMAQPVRPSESQHRVRLMFGNGLRPQLWRDFQARFGVKQMGEFYGATEGNASVINTVNKVGAVGFTTRILPFLYPITLIRVDETTGEPLRDRNGMCILVQPGESGELVGKITQNDPLRQFDGYVCKTATNKKVAKDVFRKGDLAFLTGDVLSMDRYGFLYFKDRTGDTFRWKGENVSTAEVEAVISNILKLKCAVVFGVEVPGSEGKAGMVAILDEDGTVDVSCLAADIGRSLPPYARPLFVRLVKEMESTGTYKLKKTDLKAQSYNPNKVKDRLYYLDSKSRQYQPLTKEVYRDISEGKLAF